MPRKKTKPGKTFVAIVLDKSSSISAYGLTQAVVDSFNARVEALREQARLHKLEIYLTLITFEYKAEVVFENQPIAEVKRLDHYSYRPWGNTALFDGVGLAVERLKTFAKVGPNDAFLVETITDGEENNSSRYGVNLSGRWNFGMIDIVELMRDRTAEGNWTFAFQLPKGYGDRFSQNYSIPRDNIMEWDQTVVGVERATVGTQLGFSNYFENRSRGMMSVKNFYNVTTDLSQLSTKQVKKELDDISNRFKTYTVAKEQSVKEFVEAKTGKPYVIGAAYYQLMKPEKVQPKKSVLIMEKGKKAVWGGDEARELIGLPTDGVSHARVTPGNHSNYDIFIQSTSVNRKLPRGTKVLVDTSKKVNSTPTWDHKAVAAKA